MRNIIVLAAFSLCNLSPIDVAAENAGALQRPKMANPVTKSLTFDQKFADYINNQIVADEFNQIIVWADSILLGENVTFQQADVVFVSNHFSTGDYEIRVIPIRTDSTNSDFAGQNGRHVRVISKQVNEVRFYIPGVDGSGGKGGRKGKNGKRGDARPTPQGGSRGTAGENGKAGGNGGTGGKLTISSYTENYNVNLRAPGGKGGSGGEGGKGGTSYVAKGSKIVNAGKPNEKIIYAIETKREKEGRLGKNGSMGENGEFSKIVIDEKTFDEQIRHLFSADAKQLYMTGWQVVLTTSVVD